MDKIMEKPSAQSFKQLATSVEKLPASMGRQVSIYATQRAHLLLGCYRTGEANDPDTYVAAIAATLARYSEATITSVTHPVSGLPSKKSWLPTVKEVFDACEELADYDRQQIAREARVRAQLAEREAADKLAAHKPSFEELKAKYGENWGLTPRPPKPDSGFKAPTAEEIRAHYRDYGLAFQPKDLAARSVETIEGVK